MRTVEIKAAEMELSSLVAEAEAGGEVVLARDGRPVARLVPLEVIRPKRVLGALNGRLHVPDDFDTMFEDEIREMFEGK